MYKYIQICNVIYTPWENRSQYPVSSILVYLYIIFTAYVPVYYNKYDWIYELYCIPRGFSYMACNACICISIYNIM